MHVPRKILIKDVLSNNMKRCLLVVLLLASYGCRREYKPILTAKMVALAQPVVEKWHDAGFTRVHAASEKYWKQAEQYYYRDVKQIHILIKQNVEGNEQRSAELDALEAHFASSPYQKESELLCDLLRPGGLSGPAANPTNGWTL